MARIVVAIAGKKVVRTLSAANSNAIVQYYKDRLGPRPVDPNDLSLGTREATIDEVITMAISQIVGPYIDSVYAAEAAKIEAAYQAKLAALKADMVDVFSAD